MTYKNPSALQKLKDQGLSDVAIGALYGVTGVNIRYFRRKFGIAGLTPKGNRKYTLDTTFFSAIQTPEQAYVLGLIAADGSVHNNGKHVTIAISQTDAELLQKVLDVVNSTAPILTKKRSKTSYANSKDLSCIHICSKSLVADLARYGITPNKCHSLTYPPQLPTYLDRHFIRGLWDGDGSISKWQFGLSGTEALLKTVLERILSHTSISGGIYPQRKTTNCFKLHYHRQDAPILHWFYLDSTIHMERKYTRFLRYWM